MSETTPPPPNSPAEVSSTDDTPRPRRHRGVLRWLTWLGFVFVVALAVFYGRQHFAKQNQPPRTPPPIPVVVAAAEKGDIGVFVIGLGTVTPLNTITVTTRVDGQLMAVR